MDYAKESLKLHEQWKGKIEVVETVPDEIKRRFSTCVIHREWRNLVLPFRKMLIRAMI